MIPPSTTITEEGRRTRRVLLWLAVVVVGLNLLVWVATRLSSGGGVTGPIGSSYVTTSSGTAALEGTLGRLGYATRQLRTPLDEVQLDPRGTLVVIDVGAAEYTAGELNAIDGFVRDGGRLVVAGPADMVERLLADAPTWRAGGAEQAEVVGDLAGPAPADPVLLSGFGSLEATEEDVPFLVARDGTVVGIGRTVGDGTVLWSADSFPLHNDGLGDPAAAVTAVSMIDPSGPILFDEYRHGYTDEGGVWAVIPPRWRTALVLAGVAALVALIGYGRRFGPPYDTHRRLPPGREEYLEAVAGILARTGDREEALGIIREEALRRLEERSGGASLESAAEAAGLDPDARAAVLGDDASDETLVAADRALATLIREKR